MLKSYETLCIFASFKLIDERHEKTLSRYGVLNPRRDGLPQRWRPSWGRPVIPFLAHFIQTRPYDVKLGLHNPSLRFPALDETKFPVRRRGVRQSDIGVEAWQTCLPSLLNRILDDLDVVAEERFASLVTLLEHIDDYTRCSITCRDFNNPALPTFVSRSIFDLSDRFFPRWDCLDFYPLSNYRAIAAIILKKEALYSQLFALISEHPSMRGGYLGTPIWAAIRTGQHDLAQRFCNALNLSSERRFRWLLVPAVESGDLAMVQFVERMQNATGQISERYGDVAQALKHSLELGLDEIVNHLLETLRERKSPRGYDCFKPRLQQLYFCCTIFDDLPMFLLLIEAEKFLGFQLCDSCRLDQVAAWAGSVNILEWFLARKTRPPSDRPTWYLISAAVHGNRADSLKVLIDKY